MAISVDWPSKIIHVPKADTLFTGTDPVSGRELRSLDTDAFRKSLRDLEDDADGRAFDVTHEHNPPVTVGGVPLGRVINIINGYAVEFEDGQYRVTLTGSNSNIADVAVVNQVQVVPTNSAGLVQITSGSGLDASQSAKLDRVHALLDVIEGDLDHAEMMRLIASSLLAKASGAATTNMKFRDLADTKDRIDATVDEYGNRSAVILDAT